MPAQPFRPASWLRPGHPEVMRGPDLSANRADHRRCPGAGPGAQSPKNWLFQHVPSGDAAGFRLQTPGLGAVGGISGHDAGGGRMPAPAGFGGEVERDAGPGQAGGDFDFVFALHADDERDAVGGRLQAGAAAAGWPPGEVRTSPMLFRRRMHTPSPGLRGPCCPPAAGVSAVGEAEAASPARRPRRCRLARPAPVPGAAVACRRGTAAAGAGPGQSSAGCQSTGGGSEPCLMMLAYTLSSASLSGPTRPSGSPSKNRRRTRSTCPAAASC